MTEFEGQVLADLHVLKAQMEQVMGIGQPGRLHEIEARLAGTERATQRIKGVVAALGPLLAVVHVALGYFTGKHS